ncbi:TonB-dependent siderophore receptor [Diaphorobacter nitroreducens]|uniref:TonB-dependent siderophore receptor n=1 Tax=Diaphorobacter nitroreducens TaxID=164759 RepID=UPI0016510054|nr:TonB-dependent receptor [Diaphorobacter nitroreducens]
MGHFAPDRREERVTRSALEYGSFNRKQISGDFGGALTDDGVWSWRLTGLKRDSDTFIDSTRDDRTYIAPALKWQPNATTSLTFLSEYQHDKANWIAGLPLEGTVLSNPNGQLPRSRFAGIPGYDGYDNKKWSVGYLFEHAINDDLKLRHSLRYFNARHTFGAVYLGTYDTTNWRTMSGRSTEDWPEERTDVAVSDTSLAYRWSAAGIDHTSLFGMDYTWWKWKSTRYYGRTATDIDIYSSGSYGSVSGDPSYVSMWNDTTKQLGFYIQDQMKFANRWVLTLGGRHDRVHHTSDSASGDPSSPDRSYADEHDSATTGRAGLVYLADNGLAPFISFSQSFQPQAGMDRTGGRFKPTRGEQKEVGIRYQPEGSSTLLTATAYDLVQTNVTVTDPVDQNSSIQQGKVRSRGLELGKR